MAEARVIGTRGWRPDGVEKVTGAAAYGADLKLPGMLFARVLRSPHPHARILSIDTSKAEKHPGVMAVVTGADFPEVERRTAELGETAIETNYLAQLVIARDKALFKGHAVAAVAATSLNIAEEALNLIEVQYEVLAPVRHVLHAMEKDAPILHDDLFTKSMAGTAKEPSNIGRIVHHESGSPEEGFAQADVVVEREFETAWVHQGYIEPQCAAAQVHPDGRITVYANTQGIFMVREQVGLIMNIPLGRIKVVPMEVGGGFGGKTYACLEPLCVALSRKTNRPVKVWMSRAEVFQATGPAPGTVMRVKAGAKKSGELVAADITLIFDAGCMPGSAVGAACGTVMAPYAKCRNFRIKGYDVVTNKPRSQAYRAPGAPQAAFAIEQVIDELAQRTGLDPIDFRLKNASVEGDRRADGPVFQRIGLMELLNTVKKHPAYTDPVPAGAYRGVAAGFWFNHGGPSSATVTLNEDGTVHVATGSIDLNGVRAAFMNIAAEEMGVEPSQVTVAQVDTDSVGYSSTTGGSRVTYATGTAIYLACQDARQQLQERAAKILKCAPEDLEWEPGRFVLKSDRGKWLSLKDVTSRQNATGGAVIGKGAVSNLKPPSAFAVHVADLKVDRDTGKVEILRYTAFQDVGKAIHPTYVEGQIQGGAVQGIGWALTEGYIWEDAVMKNPSLLDYKVLTALDVPNIDVHYIEVPAPEGPYGVRGVGEVPIVPPMATIANALARATGARLTELPMTPERVLFALEGQQAADD